MNSITHHPTDETLAAFASGTLDEGRSVVVSMGDGTDTAAENVFTRRDGTIRHFWGAELGFESADPGKDPATEPDLMMLWNVLDWTPEGRGTDWYPKITY